MVELLFALICFKDELLDVLLLDEDEEEEQLDDTVDIDPLPPNFLHMFLTEL